MLLTVDIGNTNITMALIDENQNIAGTFRLTTKAQRTSDEYGLTMMEFFRLSKVPVSAIEDVIISSVVPKVMHSFNNSVRKYVHKEPIIVGPGIKTGLSIRIDNPAQLGSDLVVAAVAGIQEYTCPMILIDMGTATTYSVIDENKNYLGGLITTGMAVSSDALVSRTSQLPRISFDSPKKVIGTNTVDCIKSGILYSNAAAIDGIVDRIEKELGKECTVVATGGLSHLVASLCNRKLILDDDLLLKGLMYLYEKNT